MIVYFYSQVNMVCLGCQAAGSVVIDFCIIVVHGTSSKLGVVYVGCGVLFSLLHLLTVILGDVMTVSAFATDGHKVCKTQIHCNDGHAGRQGTGSVELENGGCGAKNGIGDAKLARDGVVEQFKWSALVVLPTLLGSHHLQVCLVHETLTLKRQFSQVGSC